MDENLEEVPGMGAEYILDNCLDNEEDRNSFGEWLDGMKHMLEKQSRSCSI
jgi:hypothetical protein